MMTELREYEHRVFELSAVYVLVVLERDTSRQETQWRDCAWRNRRDVGY